MNKNSKKLFDCIMEIENSMYPERYQKQLQERTEICEKLINDFGVNFVTITTYTNMMQPSYSVTLDTFSPEKFMNGDLEIGLGSEPQEFWANRNNSNKKEFFDFKNWEWITKEKK